MSFLVNLKPYSKCIIHLVFVRIYAEQAISLNAIYLNNYTTKQSITYITKDPSETSLWFRALHFYFILSYAILIICKNNISVHLPKNTDS